MKNDTRHIALCAVCAALVASACGKSDAEPSDAGPPAPPGLAEIVVEDATPPDLRPEGVAERASEAVEGAFLAPSAFGRAPDEADDACRAAARIGYALTVNDEAVAEAFAGEARAVVEAELFCPSLPRGEDTFRVRVQDSAAFGGDDPAGLSQLTSLVATLARRAAENLRGQYDMREADDARVLAALAGGEHAGVLAEAASEAGERRLEAAIDDLVRLTAHDEPLVSVRAGAALGLLKASTREAVRALAKMVEGSSLERHVVAIHALGDVGTDEARRYLDNLAVSHPEAAVRELARETLRELRERPDE